jgi:transposase
LDRDKVKLREWVVRKHAQGWSLDEIAGHAQVPKSTCQRWISWAKQGRTLEDLSKRPKHVKRTSRLTVLEIIVLRLLFWWDQTRSLELCSWLPSTTAKLRSQQSF